MNVSNPFSSVSQFTLGLQRAFPSKADCYSRLSLPSSKESYALIGGFPLNALTMIASGVANGIFWGCIASLYTDRKLPDFKTLLITTLTAGIGGVVPTLLSTVITNKVFHNQYTYFSSNTNVFPTPERTLEMIENLGTTSNWSAWETFYFYCLLGYQEDQRKKVSCIEEDLKKDKSCEPSINSLLMQILSVAKIDVLIKKVLEMTENLGTTSNWITWETFYCLLGYQEDQSKEVSCIKKDLKKEKSCEPSMPLLLIKRALYREEWAPYRKKRALYREKRALSHEIAVGQFCQEQKDNYADLTFYNYIVLKHSQESGEQEIRKRMRRVFCNTVFKCIFYAPLLISERYLSEYLSRHVPFLSTLVYKPYDKISVTVNWIFQVWNTPLLVFLYGLFNRRRPLFHYFGPVFFTSKFTSKKQPPTIRDVIQLSTFTDEARGWGSLKIGVRFYPYEHLCYPNVTSKVG